MKKNKNKSIPILISAIILAGVIAGIYFAFFSNSAGSNNANGINYNLPTSDQKNAGATTKSNSLGDGSKPNTSGSDQAAPPVPQPNGKGKVNATLTYASETEDHSTLRVGTTIGAVTDSGTCTLTLTKNGVTVTKTAGVQALAGSSTCKGFSIPISELSSGTWQIALHFESSDMVADTTGSTVVN